MITEQAATAIMFTQLTTPLFDAESVRKLKFECRELTNLQL